MQGTHALHEENIYDLRGTAVEMCNHSSDNSDKRMKNGAFIVDNDLTDRYMSTKVCKVEGNA